MGKFVENIYNLGFLILMATVELRGAESKESSSSSDRFVQDRQLFYHFSQHATTWSEAYRECHSLEGHLVTPANPVLDNSLRMFTVGSQIYDKVWTGGRVSRSDSENKRIWFWETYNLPITYSNFHGDSSSSCAKVDENSCLVAYTWNQTINWGWCGYPCTSTFHYICEFGTPPPLPTTTDISTGSTEEPTTEIELPTTDQTTTDPSFVCPPSSGSFADPLNCAKFYICENGVIKNHFTCPANLLWNDLIKTCDYPENVDCGIMSTTSIPITTTSPEGSTTELTTSVPTSKPPDFVCPLPDGSFSDPKDCTRYYVFVNGDVVAHKTCPVNKLWNNSAKVCDDPWNIDCQNLIHI